MANLYSQRKIIKIPTSELENSKWNLSMSYQELKENDYIVALASSYITRSLDDISNNNYSECKINELKNKIKKISNSKNSAENRREYKMLKDKLDSLLYLPHLVCLRMTKSKHYNRANKGFVINGVRYKRLMSTPASIKRVGENEIDNYTYNGDIFYVNEQFLDELNKRIDNGRKDKPFVPAKLSGYRALTMSASTPVTNTKNVLVVHDVITKFKTKVIELGECVDGRPKKSIVDDYDMELNASDGFGFISPEFANVWACDLKLDYIPSGFIGRNSFMKGVSVVFDFKKFGLEVAKNNIVSDVWGNEWDINDVDLVLTTSMLKLWDCYDSYEDYYNNCIKNKYTFSITKYTPNVLDEERRTNYQFVQSLNLTDDEIHSFVQPTIDEIKEIQGNDYRKSIIYLKGIGLTEDLKINKNDFITGLMIEPSLINDSFVSTTINNMIKKRINDAKKGAIKVKGNYQTITIDPYCLAQHIFGIEVKGLLKENEIYSKFWIEKNVKQVGAFRAPMVSRTNCTKVNVVCDSEMLKWYKYMDGLLIINAWDSLCARESGMDADGDSLFTTNDKHILKGIDDTLPVVCLQKTSSKKICYEDDFIESDKMLLNSKTENVGVITNKATCIQSIQSNFEKNSPEWEELEYRIMASILHSQESIDVAKGIETSGGIPKCWVSNKPSIVSENDTDDVIKEKLFNQKLVANKKPYFFTYIYPKLMKEYKDLVKNENIRCRRYYGKTLSQVIETKDKSEDEENTIKYFNIKKPVDETPCLMNKICWYIEHNFENMKLNKKDNTFNANVLKSGVKYKKSDKLKVEESYKKYIKKLQKFIYECDLVKMSSSEKGDKKMNIDYEFKNELKNICNNEIELCDILIDVCYKSNNAKGVVWSVCGDQIIKNLLLKNNNIISYPVRSECSDFEYMGIGFKMHSKYLEVE